jgi:hypothetical protein
VYRRQGKQLVLAAEPIGSHGVKNRPCLLLEINDAERGKCRADRHNAGIAVFFVLISWNTNVTAHNICDPASNFRA